MWLRKVRTMINFETFSSIILSSGATGLIIIWLTKKWIGERITESIKHEYNISIEQLKADLKANGDVALERLKADLLVQEKKVSTRYSILHEKRIDAIVKLYTLLNRAKNRVILDIELAKKDPEKFKEKLSRGQKEYNELNTHFEENKLYLSKSLERLIDGASWHITRPRFLSVYISPEVKANEPSFKSFHKLLVKSEEGHVRMLEALRCIEDDFRMLLGVEIEEVE